MEVGGSRLPAAVAAVSAAALVGGLAGQAAWVGCAAAVLTALLAGLGLRAPQRASRATVAALGAFGGLCCALIALAYALHAPEKPLATIGGLPAGTAPLVYGLPPLGVGLGLLYGLAFDREILPFAKQRDFLERFARK